jgi:hypothetical protein
MAAYRGFTIPSLELEANMLHQRNRVSALSFACSDPVVESHFEFIVFNDKRLLKMKLLTLTGEVVEVQQR